MTTVSFDVHPLLDAVVFETHWPRPLIEIPSPPAITGLLTLTAEAPLHSDDPVREAIRALLRHGGFKPSGRSKPASEYLVRAATEGTLQPINVAVDIINAVSLHSGLPISIVDLDQVKLPLLVGVASAGTEFAFNPSGQVIQVGGLLTLLDADGPCANAVRDAQRTKTRAETRRTLTVIWGSHTLPSRAASAGAWACRLGESVGATHVDVDVFRYPS